MKVLRYRNDVKRARGYDGSTTLVVYTAHVHLFAFRYGIATRIRLGENWRHFAIRLQGRRFDVGPGIGHASLMVETWLTSGGTAVRVPLSKKYVALKVLG